MVSRLSRLRSACSLILLPLLVSCGGGTPQSATAPAPTRTVAELSASSAAQADYTRMLQQIYIAYFGRPADPGGQDFWSARYSDAGLPVEVTDLWRHYGDGPKVSDLVDIFGKSKESNDLYAGDDGQFIDAIYYNIFSRAPDSAGKDFWLDKLKTGVLTRPVTAITLLGAASGDDLTTLANKLRAAERYTAQVRKLDQSRFGSDSANALLRNMMRTITATTTALDVDAKVDAAMAAILDKTGVIASPGPAQTAVAGDTVRLNGAASASLDGSAVAYAWKIVEAPAEMPALLDAASATPSFVAPSPGRYVLALTVKNRKTTSDPALTYVNVVPHNFPVTGDNLYAVSVSGNPYISPETRASSSDLFGAAEPGSFWNVCQNPDCQVYFVDGYQSNGFTSGQLGVFNLNANPMQRGPVNVKLQLYPGNGGGADAGSYVLRYDANPAGLLLTPAGMRRGFNATQSLTAFASAHGAGMQTLYLSGAVRDDLVPAGWSAQAETVVDVSLYASWYDADGQPVQRTVPVLSRHYTGGFAEALTLDLNLDHFPDIKASSASYDIRISNRILFSRN